ncbi:hypothetical protein M0208_15405 [Sphingomonas sp. SUN019]|uniref:hypothetical protein n=1 Tax=Sphingomonas sp. SUN019 TaxID=2937788 RepID=UPI0021645D33|nr:hypothetical protein [Sphingomonas sp. SUN019]UVO51829.1 hypothetical protein M0208_15405 [Sphingomonas sp. SUN019]
MMSPLSSPCAALLAALLLSPYAAQAQPVPSGVAVPAAGPDYADLAELVIGSPLVIDATIRSTSRIKGAEAAAVPPGVARFYVEADVTALVRGPGAIPPRVGYLLDAPLDSDGRIPKYKKTRVLLFARPVAGRANQVQLVTPGAQRAWSPSTDALARKIVGELVATDAPPDITGVGNAFHVAGSLPGEGETQVFLATADRRPVSLSILRRPGEAPRWAVALSEIVDDSAGPPRRDTLLWYRLACGLPRDLPERSTESIAPDDAAKAREDYSFVLEQLGPCGRG